MFPDPFTILAVIAAVSGGASAIQGAQAAKTNSRAQAAQREQQNMRAAMERRQAIRQQRIAFATAEQNAENQGVADGSSQGGRGSIDTQGNVNLSFLDNNMQFANKIGSLADKSAGYQASAGAWGAVSNLAMTSMNFMEVPAWLKSTTPQAQLPKAQRPPGQMSYPNGYFPQKGG